MRGWWVVLFAVGACVPECKVTYEPCLYATDKYGRCVPFVDGDIEPCDAYAQTGCGVGERCTWIVDLTYPATGHIGCALDGSVELGSACTFDDPYGPDNCMKGAICAHGTCEPICDLFGGTATCASGFACQVSDGVFEIEGDYVGPGACERTCDPLADNDALGSGMRAGSACGSNEGCYGVRSRMFPTQYSCMRELNPTLIHRSTCDAANGCNPDPRHPVVNGCAQGYAPLVDLQTGSSTVTCVALCKPADCWLGNCPDDQLRGVPPHDCTSASARGTFAVASAGGSNGDQCAYSWGVEYATGGYSNSNTGDTIGFCIDHSQRRYDANADGVIDASDPVWPRCDTLDIMDGSDAAYFGCVSTTTAVTHGHPL